MTEFKCKRCGKCCGIVPFLKNEYKAIRDIAKKKHIGFVKEDMNGKVVYFPKIVYKNFLNAVARSQQRGSLLLDNEVDNLHCPFLEVDVAGLSACSIYDKRPEICRLFGKGGHPYLTCPHNLQVNLRKDKDD